PNVDLLCVSRVVQRVVNHGLHGVSCQRTPSGRETRLYLDDLTSRGDANCATTRRISLIDRIPCSVPIEVGLAMLKEVWVAGGPSPDLGVVVSGAEADEACVEIIDAAGEAERLKAWVRVH